MFHFDVAPALPCLVFPAVPLLGRSYQPFIALLGAWIAIVFAVIALLTHASRARVRRALVGALGAGTVNVGLDAVAHHFGWWRYPETTTPFGPLVYYAEAGLGFGALALLTVWLHRRFGLRSVLVLVIVLCIYGPLRDHRTADLTGLIEFRAGLGVVLADALLEWVIPYLVAVGITGTGETSDGRAVVEGGLGAGHLRRGGADRADPD